MASENSVSIPSGNGMWHVRRQSITWTMADVLSVGPLELQRNLNQNERILIQDNAFENTLIKMSPIMSQCVKFWWNRSYKIPVRWPNPWQSLNCHPSRSWLDSSGYSFRLRSITDPDKGCSIGDRKVKCDEWGHVITGKRFRASYSVEYYNSVFENMTVWCFNVFQMLLCAPMSIYLPESTMP